jgi:hypothetical protein
MPISCSYPTSFLILCKKTLTKAEYWWKSIQHTKYQILFWMTLMLFTHRRKGTVFQESEITSGWTKHHDSFTISNFAKVITEQQADIHTYTHTQLRNCGPFFWYGIREQTNKKSKLPYFDSNPGPLNCYAVESHGGVPMFLMTLQPPHSSWRVGILPNHYMSLQSRRPQPEY